MIVKVTDADFDEFTKEGVVAVDCFADWCPPCKMLAPVIEKLSEEIEGMKFGKLNTDENPEIAEKYEIRSIPNILVFKGGKLVEQIVGFYPEDALREKFNSILK